MQQQADGCPLPHGPMLHPMLHPWQASGVSTAAAVVASMSGHNAQAMTDSADPINL